MKIIQVNIWHGKLMHPIKHFIRDQKPDFVCMQEVNDMPGESGSMFFTLDELRDLSHMKYSYMSPTHSYKYMHRRADFGNATLCNIEPADKKTIFTGGEYNTDTDFDEDDVVALRNFQHLTFQISGKTLNIINTHGLWVEDGKNGNLETQRQMTQIADYIKRLEGPVIFCGDLNLKPSSPSLVPFNFLQNLAAENNLICTYQPSVSNQTDVCDYIFVSKGIKVNKFEMAEKLISDHKALVLDFDL